MGRNIVVIDDSPTIRMSIKMALKEFDFNIIEAENGMDALDKINGLKATGRDVALCISDINMPVMGGFEFLSEFRKTSNFTPVIMLTTEKENETILKGKSLGATGWIIKPFHQEDLINVVKRFIK